MAPHVLRRLPERCNIYFEPFLGGGAIFIEMAKAGKFSKAVLADTNAELMCAWRVIQADVESLIRELCEGRYIYERDQYLRIRGEDPGGLDDVRKAARFIYLNKTGFNGLYRVNKDGKFNVPFGKYDNPTICDTENLRALSDLIHGATFIEADFEVVVSSATAGDAAYFDPPYIPISATSNFDGYTAGGFTMEDHQRLASAFGRLAEAGVRVVASNSSAESATALYGKYDIDWLTGTRSVGGPASYRQSVKEMIVFAGPKS